jgi:hypothetical protein
MFLKWVDNLSNKAFRAVKWLLTTMSAMLTSGLIIVLES